MMVVVAMDCWGGDEGGGARWRSSWWAGWVEARISSRPLFFYLVRVAARGAWGLAGVCGSIVVRAGAVGWALAVVPRVVVALVVAGQNELN